MQSTVFKITNYLLVNTTLPDQNSWSSNLKAEIESFDSKSDQNITLLDLIHFITKSLVTYESWTVEIRARFMQVVLKGISSKDINKRIVFMSVLLFMNRLLRQMDYVEERFAIDYKPFLNQNGLADLDTVAKAYQSIKTKLGYSTKASPSLTEAQQAEIDKLDVSMYPSNTTF